MAKEKTHINVVIIGHVDSGKSTPTSQLTKLGPDDDVEAYLEVFERTTRRENWPEERDTVSHPTSPAGEPRPIGRNRPAVSRPQTGDPSLLWT